MGSARLAAAVSPVSRSGVARSAPPIEPEDGERLVPICGVGRRLQVFGERLVSLSENLDEPLHVSSQRFNLFRRPGVVVEVPMQSVRQMSEQRPRLRHSALLGDVESDGGERVVREGRPPPAENKIEIINEVHWEWAETYRIVGLRLGLSDESMRVSATLRAPNRPYRPLSAEDAARVLNERSLHGPNAIVETTSWLKEVTSTLNTIEADRRISGVTSILQARMVAAAIYLRSDISAEQRNGLLRKWENVTFRVYGCYGEDARKRVGDYVSLAWDIAHALPAEDIVTRLTDIGMQFPIDRAIERLPETVCNTDWSTQLHYFFRRYEEHLSAQAGQKFNSEQWNRIWEKTNSDSIEHIRPQNEWSNSEDSRVHSLGNLMILPPGLNSKLQDKPVTEKAKAYRETGLLLANEIANSVAKMRIKSHWTLAAIEAREKSLLKWARQEWAD